MSAGQGVQSSRTRTDFYIGIGLSDLVEILVNTPKESNGQSWGAWTSLVEMC